MYNKMGLTGREIIQWVKEHEAEDMVIWFQPQPGYAFKEAKEIDFEHIGFVREIVAIKQ